MLQCYCAEVLQCCSANVLLMCFICLNECYIHTDRQTEPLLEVLADLKSLIKIMLSMSGDDQMSLRQGGISVVQCTVGNKADTTRMIPLSRPFQVFMILQELPLSINV